MLKPFLTVALMLAVFIAGCGDDDDGGDNTPAPSTEGTSIAAASPASEVIASETFEPAVAMTVAGDWDVVLDTATELIVDHPREVQTPGGVIAFALPEKVYNPENTLEQQDTPADLVDWFNSHRLLIVRAEEAATLGGLTGTRLEVVANNVDDFPLFEVSDGAFEIRFNEHFYAYVLDSDGQQMLVFVSVENPAQLSTFMTAAQPALDSVEFTP